MWLRHQPWVEPVVDVSWLSPLANKIRYFAQTSTPATTVSAATVSTERVLTASTRSRVSTALTRTRERCAIRVSLTRFIGSTARQETSKSRSVSLNFNFIRCPKSCYLCNRFWNKTAFCSKVITFASFKNWRYVSGGSFNKSCDSLASSWGSHVHDHHADGLGEQPRHRRPHFLDHVRLVGELVCRNTDWRPRF